MTVVTTFNYLPHISKTLPSCHLVVTGQITPAPPRATTASILLRIRLIYVVSRIVLIQFIDYRCVYYRRLDQTPVIGCDEPL
ncbi:hypothetical protein KP389_003997 [Salmonella enterica subsp. enterica serovar Infantis]|nr:hypothetical protein [Salmonella enterica subsp. enterica serovar Infantis]